MRKNDVVCRDLVKKILSKEVVPTLGCTEPGAVAYACSIAGKKFKNKTIIKIKVIVDPATYKNAFGVTIPGTNKKGIAIAAALGVISGDYKLKLEALQNVNAKDIEIAKKMIEEERVDVVYVPNWENLRIMVIVENKNNFGYAVIDGEHTNVALYRHSKEKIDITKLYKFPKENISTGKDYGEELRSLDLADLIYMAKSIDDDDRAYIEKGISLNRLLAKAGTNIKGVGNTIQHLVEDGTLDENLITQTQILIASATDARMAGISYPAMSSGGSGNQGILAILAPHLIGKKWNIDNHRIQESITLSHVLNSYIKCFLGNLSPMCGCAVSAGVGAAAAITYLRTDDPKIINAAINNVIADISGMLCDGAKGGCARKVTTATEVSIMAALFALKCNTVDNLDGIIGNSFKETIKNLSLVGKNGIKTDPVVLKIMANKSQG